MEPTARAATTVAEPVPRSLTVGERLVRCGAITRDQLEEALEAQAIFGGRIGTNLLELGYVDEKTLNRVLSEKHHVPTLEEGVVDPAPDPKVLELIPQDLVRKYRVFPVRLENKRLHVLMEDPSLLAQIDELSFRTGLIIQPCVASEARVAYLLERYFKIRRDTRYVLLSKGVAGDLAGPPKPDPTVESASDAMRMNWLSEGDEGAGSGEEILTLTEEEELIPEDLHRTIFTNVERPAETAGAPARPDAAPSPGGSRTGRPYDRRAGGPLGVRETIERLSSVKDRDDVARVLLAFTLGRSRRAAIFMVRDELVLGWDGAGDGVDGPALRALKLPLDRLAAFSRVVHARSPLIGDVFPDPDKPEIRQFLRALGGAPPQSALLAPILLRDRVVNLLYADGGPGADAPDGAEEIIEVLRGVPGAFAALLRRRKAMVTD